MSSVTTGAFKKGDRVKVSWPHSAWCGPATVTDVYANTVSVIMDNNLLGVGGFSPSHLTLLSSQTEQDSRLIGIGGAPTRATTLPEGAAERKKYPVATGFLDYFPDAIVAVAHISYCGNEQHNPGKPLHWDRSKSADEDDTIARHFLQRGTLDTDGKRHTAKLAWRALALLQKEIEAEQAAKQ